MSSTYHEIKAFLDARKVQLIAVSKTRPIAQLMPLYEAGQRDFGENRVQEMREKHELMPSDIRWHLIGHLQRNKVKYIAPWVHMIHSVDSADLLKEIDRQAVTCNRVIPCLLQIYVATEETKFGLDEPELMALLSSEAFHAMHNIQICGLMGMATNTENQEQIRKEFATLHAIFERTKARFFAQDNNFKELSMGMSSDYNIAVEQCSTMVRIGSLLFN